MELTNEDLKILQDASDILMLSDSPSYSDLVYRTPAQALREEADAIERRDKVIRAFRNLIRRLQWLPEVSTVTFEGSSIGTISFGGDSTATDWSRIDGITLT